ncbi:MAG TPA: methyltransferase domain-containing protein [Rhodothermales bacterium]|nr:methyltransferase domain-containing protein [Rhodothermales bacterium]
MGITPMPDLSTRTAADEMMDDFSITDVSLTRALEDLRKVNGLLGGYRSVIAPLAGIIAKHGTSAMHPVRILDVGTGIADIPEYVVRWADRRGLHVEFVALDANPATVVYAGRTLGERLPSELRDRIHLAVGDALALPYTTSEFHVTMSNLFMHHLDPDDAVEHLRSLQAASSNGILVNDLHRHPLAYHAIRILAPFLSGSPMFHHDAPLSVARAFSRADLEDLARRACFPHPRISWHWAFRWSLSTLQD